MNEKAENLVWVLLENDLWWPGFLPTRERNEVLNSRQPSHLQIVTLFGTEERVIVDLTRTEEIQVNTPSHTKSNFFTLYLGQNIPECLQGKFSLALEQFNSCAPLPDTTDPADSTSSNSLVQNPSLKRIDALTWEDYFIAVAFLSAMRSKDPSTQVGACIVNNRNRIVGIGYNGFPRGCSDDILPWARSASDELDTKYPVSRVFCLYLAVRHSSLYCSFSMFVMQK
jgi:deoxycytidylate deaminase